jgi:hypothetical protein
MADRKSPAARMPRSINTNDRAVAVAGNARLTAVECADLDAYA